MAERTEPGYGEINRPFPFNYLTRFENPWYDYEQLVEDLSRQSYSQDIEPVGKQIYQEHSADSVGNFTSQQIETLRFVTRYFFERLQQAGLYQSARKLPYEDVYSLNFQKGAGAQDGEDLVRLYFNPRTDHESLQIFMDELIEILTDGSVPDCHGKFFPDNFFLDHNNRFLIYANRKNNRGLTNFFRKIQQNQRFLKTMQEDGGWVTGARIPLAEGISFVEGTKNSWDTTDLDALCEDTQLKKEELMRIGRNPDMYQLRLRKKIK